MKSFLIHFQIVVKKVKREVSLAIQKARQALHLKQKELATKINEKEQIIVEYENGTVNLNQQILSKLERVLGVKLRGNEIGKPLSSNKPSITTTK